MNLFKNILLVGFIACIPTLIMAQGINFFHGTWEDAIKLAQKEEKLIFVDAYAAWCGPCKRMASTVFTDGSVGDFMNKNYVSLKLDMEKDEEGIKFREKFPVSAFPTLFYLNASGELIQKEVGGKSIEDFLKTAKFILTKVDVSSDLVKQYENGDRSPAFMADYIKALNKSGKPSLKVTNEYLMTQTNLETNENLKIIFEGATEADSKVFDYLIKYRSKIAAIVGEDVVTERIAKACNKTVEKAISFKTESLLQEATTKMKLHDTKNGEKSALLAEGEFYGATKMVKPYLASTEKYISKFVKNDAAKLHAVVGKITKAFPDDEKALASAAKYAKTAAQNGGLGEYYFTYGTILFKLKNKKEAIKALEKCVALAKEEGKTNPQAESMILKLKS